MGCTKSRDLGPWGPTWGPTCTSAMTMGDAQGEGHLLHVGEDQVSSFVGGVGLKLSHLPATTKGAAHCSTARSTLQPLRRWRPIAASPDRHH